MMGISIRIASPEEASRLTRYAPRAMARNTALINNGGAEAPSDENQIASWTIWIAEIDCQFVGMTALSIGSDNAQVEVLKIEREFQGMGVARALMDAVVAQCCQLGITCIALDADPNAEPVYWKLGFATVGYSLPGAISSHAARRMVRPVFEPALTVAIVDEGCVL